MAILAIIPSGCSTFNNNERPQKIVTIVKTKYRTIPDEYMVCPPPPVVDEEFIETTLDEAQYNRNLPLPLFNNNVQCYESMERIKKFNEETQSLNEEVINE